MLNNPILLRPACVLALIFSTVTGTEKIAHAAEAARPAPEKPQVIINTIPVTPIPSPETKPADPVEIYATVDWPDPLNPQFTTLRNDHFLLATANGMQIWDANKNVFTTAEGWPDHHALQPQWAQLGKGTLIVGSSHNAMDFSFSSLIWWNAESKTFPSTLPLEPGTQILRIMQIDQQYSLVCMRTPKGMSLAVNAAIIGLNGDKLTWVNDNSAAMRSTLYQANIRGPVDGVDQLDEPQKSAKTTPVIFNTKTCNWEMEQLPPEMHDATDLAITYNRFPDGRILVTQAHWRSPELDSSGVKRARKHEDLVAPLLWDEASSRWLPLENTAQERTARYTFSSYGINDPVVSIPVLGAQYVEFLDPQTLRWIRSEQTLPETYDPKVAPLRTGQAIVFLRESGHILLVDPMRSNPSPGKFAYSHGYMGEIPLANGGLLLVGHGTQNRPELLSITPSPHVKVIAPLPKAIGYLAGIELLDGTVLVFGGLPRECIPSSIFWDPCKKVSPEPSYRYFPAQDRWEEIPEMKLHFANGQMWDGGNSDIATQWPRNDVLVRSNGDFVYLDGEADYQRDDTDLSPLVTTPMRWRPGAPPVAMPHLRIGRTSATLLELADQRMAVIGGKTQQELVALEKKCIDCPDEFVSLGLIDWARSTEFFDDKTNSWNAGPAANYPGGRALKLANGRIFKLSLSGLWSSENGFDAEIADAAFTHWEKLPPFPIAQFKLMHITVAGNRVLMLPEAPDNRVTMLPEAASRKTVVWDDDKHSWQVWDQWSEEPPLTINAIDASRAIVRFYSSYAIVLMPK